MSLIYRPPPTIERFMQDDGFVRVLVGPIGSGKSMGCIMEILRRAREQAPYEGVRSTRWVVVRNTLQQLRTTVLADFQQYLGPMISYYTTDSTVRIRTKLDDGTSIHCDIMMIPLDTKEDQSRLLSMQLTGAWINELREVPFDIVQPLLGRLGRFPSKANGGYTWRGLIADTNPWSTDSPYHDKLVLAPSDNWKLFHQPSGIGPYAENVENLPPNYYTMLADGRDDGWAEVHIESEWGTSNAGQAVFRRSFHAPTHVRDMQPVINPHRPIIIGLDFGRTPCAVICQHDSSGRLIVHKEIITKDMGIIQMLDEELKPVLFNEPFAGIRSFVVGDPAGAFKGQLDNETPMTALRAAGFLAYPASTNNIEPRLMAVERALRQNLMGEPGLQISRTGCPTLIRALGNMYRYRKKKDGQLEDTPEKLHPWSDVVDALQYACLGAAAGLVGKVMARDRPRPRREPVSAAGWT